MLSCSPSVPTGVQSQAVSVIGTTAIRDINCVIEGQENMDEAEGFTRRSLTRPV